MLRREETLAHAGDAQLLPAQLRVTVRREALLEDSWKFLFERPTAELLAPYMSVTFKDEAGVDAGGLSRDWFDSVARALVAGATQVDIKRGGGILTTAADQTLLPRPGPEDDLRFQNLFAFGKFLALAVLSARPLPLSFSIVACKYFLRVPVGLADVRALDPVFYRGRVAQVLRKGGLDEINSALGEPLMFMSASTELRPEPAPLKSGGAELCVTEENKHEYIQLLCDDYLCGGIRRELQCILSGFWEILPLELLRACNVTPRELSVMISGISDLDPGEWRAHSRTDSEDAVQVEWFWTAVREMESEQRCLLLHFATGSSRLPPGGFADLDPVFNIEVTSGGSVEHLPHAHTCANQIVLHQYESEAQLREKLLQAIAAEGFGFA